MFFKANTWGNLLTNTNNSIFLTSVFRKLHFDEFFLHVSLVN